MDQKGLRVVIDCDDAGTALKVVIRDFLEELGVQVVDLQGALDISATYPDIGHNLAQGVQRGEYDRGILICGTGLGMAIVANKLEGVYAGVCHDVYSAERLSKSNNAQILTLGARVVGPELAKAIVRAWLVSEFAGGRSAAKVDRLRTLERRSFHRSR